ncbi:MAG: hypothetical protein KDD70_16115, partial [Bdellovibrionales bacterium]|nr:hypothetical protein [Bdellovibrionales bacterium]
SVVKVDGEILGRGEGGTKKASQQKAAEEALTVLSPRLEEIRRGHVQSSEVNGEEVQGDGSVSEELVSAEDIREEGINE